MPGSRTGGQAAGRASSPGAKQEQTPRPANMLARGVGATSSTARYQRDDGGASPTTPLHMSPQSPVIAPIPHTVAARIVAERRCLHSPPNAVCLGWGVFAAGELLGVASSPLRRAGRASFGRPRARTCSRSAASGWTTACRASVAGAARVLPGPRAMHPEPCSRRPPAPSTRATSTAVLAGCSSGRATPHGSSRSTPPRPSTCIVLDDLSRRGRARPLRRPEPNWRQRRHHRARRPGPRGPGGPAGGGRCGTAPDPDRGGPGPRDIARRGRRGLGAGEGDRLRARRLRLLLQAARHGGAGGRRSTGPRGRRGPVEQGGPRCPVGAVGAGPPEAFWIGCGRTVAQEARAVRHDHRPRSSGPGDHRRRTAQRAAPTVPLVAPAPTRRRGGPHARVSANDKDQERETQLLGLRDFARAQGWAVQSESVDHGPANDPGHGSAWRDLMDDAARKMPLRFPGMGPWGW